MSRASRGRHDGVGPDPEERTLKWDKRRTPLRRPRTHPRGQEEREGEGPIVTVEGPGSPSSTIPVDSGRHPSFVRTGFSDQRRGWSSLLGPCVWTGRLRGPEGPESLSTTLFSLEVRCLYTNSFATPRNRKIPRCLSNQMSFIV